MSTAEHVHDAVDGRTITGLLRRNARQYPEHPALTSSNEPNASTLTWSQLRTEVAALTQGLSELGLQHGERMLIAVSKRPEHWIVDLAAVHLGALPCTTYDTLSTPQIRFIAHHNAARVLVLEGTEQLRKWAPVLDELPHLRGIVLLDPAAAPEDDSRFTSYAELRGDPASTEVDTTFEDRTDAVTPDQPLTVVYTSGTTGDPKGVVLSHRNVIHESLMQEHVLPTTQHPRSVAHLPLAHIAERVLAVYMPICNAGHVTLCPDPAQLVSVLMTARPHGFFGVPRVWEKLAAGLRARLDDLPAERKAAIDRAGEIALRVFRLRSAGSPVPRDLAAEHARLDEQVLRPVRALLGLDQCDRATSGAAPIPTTVLDFLASVGIFVYEVWGMSETTGAATVSTPTAFALGAVGPPAPGVEVTTATDGELLVRGPVVSPGYLQADGTIMPGADEHGWFRTGDVGTIDERGLVAVTDRKKDLIITSAGKNIAPARIESLLRTHPLVAQAMAVGDQRRYVTALLVLDEEAAPAWARSHGIDAAGPAELAEHPEVHTALVEHIDAVNEQLARVEQVKRHRVLTAPWTVESGELTAKLSVRRRVIEDRYAGEIAELYD